MVVIEKMRRTDRNFVRGNYLMGYEDVEEGKQKMLKQC